MDASHDSSHGSHVRIGRLAGAVVVALLAATGPAPAAERSAEDLESYSYVRALEGDVTLAAAGNGPGEAAEANQPLLSGDHVQVGRGARVEIVLADRNLLRLGGDTALTLTRIAYSGDRDDRTTRLDLEAGELVLVVSEDALGDQLPEIRAGSLDVVIHRPGTYRVASWPGESSEVLVRDGYAEVVSRGGSSILRAGEMAVADAGGAGLEIVAAAGPGALEQWGDGLARHAAQAGEAVAYVEPELAYQAAPLAEHGSWVEVDSSWYWRPYVAAGWRPYWNGRWAWTPSGLTWVSHEPWGWVPYHYGSWSQLAGYGWAWSPGYRYSPAWVYWHWSDAWVGWCPTGYYTSWYDPWYYGGYRWGHYGWAGGGWGYYRDWCFRPSHRVCDRDGRRWQRHGGDLERELGTDIPRGVLTTDTGGIPRRRFEEPGVADEIVRRARLRNSEDLPDVTDFVARKRDLPPAVERAVRPDPRDRRRLGDEPVLADRRGRRQPIPPVAEDTRGGKDRQRSGDDDRTRTLPPVPRDRRDPIPPVAEDTRGGKDRERSGDDDRTRTLPPVPRDRRDPIPPVAEDTRGGKDRERTGDDDRTRTLPPVPRDRRDPIPPVAEDTRGGKDRERTGDDDRTRTLPPVTRDRRAPIPPVAEDTRGGKERERSTGGADERQGWRDRVDDARRTEQGPATVDSRSPRPRPTVEPRRSPAAPPSGGSRAEAAPTTDGRQGWREREGSAARVPVQRVLDSVRRLDRAPTAGRTPPAGPSLDARGRGAPGASGPGRVTPRGGSPAGGDRPRATVSPRTGAPTTRATSPSGGDRGSSGARSGSTGSGSSSSSKPSASGSSRSGSSKSSASGSSRSGGSGSSRSGGSGSSRSSGSGSSRSSGSGSSRSSSSSPPPAESSR